MRTSPEAGATAIVIVEPLSVKSLPIPDFKVIPFNLSLNELSGFGLPAKVKVTFESFILPDGVSFQTKYVPSTIAWAIISSSAVISGVTGYRISAIIQG